MFYSGDELYGDDVTSGIFDGEPRRLGASDHTHECRDCGGDYTRCTATNEECLSIGPKAHGSFNGLCDGCEDADQRAAQTLHDPRLCAECAEREYR